VLLLLGLLAACADGEIVDPAGPGGDFEDDQFDEGTSESTGAGTSTFDKSLTSVGGLVSARTCTTATTSGLNLQIAQEIACMAPGRFESIADIPNVRLGAGANPFVQGSAARALRQAAAANPGSTFEVNSSWRSVVQQYVLKQWEGSCGISIAATPGRSRHEAGLSLDVTSSTTDRFKSALRSNGWTWYCDRTNGGRYSGCGDTPHWDYLNGEDMRALGVKAFQRLWNRQNPNDRISEDGIYGNNTASRIRQAPLAGFAAGTSCSPADNPVVDAPTNPDPVDTRPSGEEVALDQLSKDVQGLRTDTQTRVWHTSLTSQSCGAASVPENFSSGRFNAHRWAASLDGAGPVTVRYERTAGTFKPALFIFDDTGELIFGGDASGSHRSITAEPVSDGRDGRAAEVKLTATAFARIAIFVTDWTVVDAGMGANITTQARYTLTATQTCGADTPTGSGELAAFYNGLTVSGMEVPRAGVANGTLQQVHGVSTEQYGDIATEDGLRFVSGTVSWFGGPNDTGVSSTETGSITFERLRSLNNPVNPDQTTLDSRPEDYFYIAMRWNYAPLGREWWANARLLVVNPDNGRAIVVRPVDWGPNIRTTRIMDLSPQALNELGLRTDQTALVSFAPAGSRLGRVK